MNKRLRKTVYGDYAKNPVAYCKLHTAVITVKQLRGKQCLEKKCRYLCRYEHDFWRSVKQDEQ